MTNADVETVQPATATNVPTKPFAWSVTGQPGERNRNVVWSVPFDTEYRPVKVPNAPDIAIPALASIGEHVVMYAAMYCPAYKVIRTINSKVLNSKAEADAALADNDDYIVILDRRNGNITHLGFAFSEREALVSWFSRELGHNNSVLCIDRIKNETYIEARRQELTVCLDVDGREVAVDEPHASESYLIEKHTNAIMIFGE